MKICLISTHSFPISLNNRVHTGDIVILDLARSLQQLGHTVSLIAPKGTDFNNLYPMKASYGQFPPTSEECEEEAFNQHKDMLLQQDIVHDFSVSKRITVMLNHTGFFNTVCTILGGAWKQNYSPRNLCVWSKAHRSRVLRGATDYEGTPTPDLAGSNGRPVQDCHVVYGGIDTEFYQPTAEKEGFYLWMNRWHPVKGYLQAIQLAKMTGIPLVLAGEHPDNEMFEFQRNCAKEAMKEAKGYKNIDFYFLPPDPDHHTAKRDLYSKAKALLYTVQFHEPFGLSQVEALSCGTPVIATNYGSCPEVINHVTGSVCDNNLNAFANVLKKEFSPTLCRKRAAQMFDRRVMAQNYLKQYKMVLEGKDW